MKESDSNTKLVLTITKDYTNDTYNDDTLTTVSISELTDYGDDCTSEILRHSTFGRWSDRFSIIEKVLYIDPKTSLHNLDDLMRYLEKSECKIELVGTEATHDYTEYTIVFSDTCGKILDNISGYEFWDE